jgi:glucose/arabinose dehydrogenase
VRTFTILAVAVFALGCGAGARDPDGELARFGAPMPECDADNGGLVLADGFCAFVAHEGVGAARHIAVAPNGHVYVAVTGRQNTPAGVIALRDTNGDGRLDEQQHLETMGGTGVAVHDGWLYFAPNTHVDRYRLDGAALLPTGEAERVVSGFPEQRSHAAKTMTFDAAGNLYVNVGGPSNACQAQDRQHGSPGQDPCPELEWQTGIWRFEAGRTGLQQSDGRRYATGIRNAVALDWNHADNTLYAVQHGRDMLNVIDPDNFDASDNAELPGEEFLRVIEGADFGHPYCYWDPQQNRRVLAPEYGGDGSEVGRCADYAQPIYSYPAHWAPNELFFYRGQHFPTQYRNGAFIAWHGSWNRAPEPQRGYKVTFQRVENGRVVGEPVIFADGFAGTDHIAAPGDAEFRPMGLAVTPEGALYIVESVRGRIWRVQHR